MQRWMFWTREDIRNFLDKELHAYQKMELPCGLATSGMDRRWACDRVFRENLTGKTVLDIGSAQGYFCFAALDRGARRAVGWDINADRVTQATAIAQMRGSVAEFYQRDIEEQTPDESFDVVLCLNVLHHLTDPLATLEKLIGVTREILILEVASLGRRDRRWSGLRAWQSWACRGAPVIAVAKEKRTYYFTRKAIENLLHQRPYFAKTEIFDSDHNDRFLVKAYRHRVKRVVVVAAPTGAGKSTLIRELLSNRLPQLATRLDITDVSQWTAVKAKEIRKARDVLPETLILHYDFLRPDKTWPKSYERDPSLRLLDCAEEVAVLTLWTLPERLRDQFHKANVQPDLAAGDARGRDTDNLAWRNGGAPFGWARRAIKGLRRRIRFDSEREDADWQKRLSKYKHLLQTYEQPDRVVGLYRRWLDFCETRLSRAQRQVIVQFDESLRFLSREEWAGVIREYEQGPA